MRRIDTGTAGKQLGKIVDEVRAGGEVILTRYGREVAKIVPVTQADVQVHLATPAEPQMEHTAAAPTHRPAAKPREVQEQAGRDEILNRLNRGSRR